MSNWLTIVFLLFFQKGVNIVLQMFVKFNTEEYHQSTIEF